MFRTASAARALLALGLEGIACTVCEGIVIDQVQGLLPGFLACSSFTEGCVLVDQAWPLKGRQCFGMYPRIDFGSMMNDFERVP